MKYVYIVALVLLILVSRASFAQSVMGTATMDANWVIHLNGSTVLKEYHTDVSAVGFKSEEQAQKFFLWFRDNLFSFKDFNFATKKVTVVLYPEHLRNAWTV
ncbi:MAG: hypothetical protein RML94_16765, partial [Bacteroidia bacterium]|nr:hypothetical protein [Bacteroidia bacterium]